MAKDVKSVSIRVSDGLLEEVDALVRSGEFRSRSDVMIYAVRFYIDYRKMNEKKD